MISCIHTHSSLCDGKNTMSEMAMAAYNKGIRTFGFSGHSYVPADDFGMRPEKMAEYRAEAARLRAEYAGRMEILCGLELDESAPEETPLDGLDYMIGSCHGVMGASSVYIAVDDTPERLRNGIREDFGGFAMRAVREYYRRLLLLIQKQKPDIIGHFDLICKYNGDGSFFDENSPQYRMTALDAVDTALTGGAVFEVNTGAMSRGVLMRPYPSKFLLQRILERHGRVIITTDTHSADTVDAFAQDAEELLKSIGFCSVCELSENGFTERKIQGNTIR